MYDLLLKRARFYPMTGDGSAAAWGVIGCKDGRIVAVDEPGPARETLDLAGRLVLPGLIDCHTHLVYAGDRSAEHAQRLAGASYADIARAGGGILSTVRAVREASEDGLAAQSLPRLAALVREGVTTVEIKSGYGLDTATELRMLRVARKLGEETGIRVRTTYLGAHAVPANRSREDYLAEVVDETLPAVAEAGLADAVDIFVESIGFDVADLERLAARAHELGLPLRAHTGQLSEFGGTGRAAELGALSCDHLEFADEPAVAAMAAHGTVAVLLPGAFYFLGETRRPPVDRFRQHGVPMAVASDLNPGSSPVTSLLVNMHMAGIFFRLTSAEVLLGVTRHAASALGLRGVAGTLEPGAAADFTVWDLPSPEMLTYQMGGLAPEAVYVAGRRL